MKVPLPDGAGDIDYAKQLPNLPRLLEQDAALDTKLATASKEVEGLEAEKVKMGDRIEFTTKAIDNLQEDLDNVNSKLAILNDGAIPEKAILNDGAIPEKAGMSTGKKAAIVSGTILGGAVTGGIAYSWVKEYQKGAPPKQTKG